MNKVVLLGRAVKQSEARYTQGENSMCIARYTLAVNRKYSKNRDEQEADFIPCVAFGKAGEWAEKYVKKGTKLAISGRIQTGSYTNKDGVKVYTTDVVIEEQEFAESKKSSDGQAQAPAQSQRQSQGGYVPAEQRGYNPPPTHMYEDSRTTAAPGSLSDFMGFGGFDDGFDEELPFN